MQDFKALTSITGKILGEAFETSQGFGYYHHETDHEEGGFETLEAAYDALWVYHEVCFEG